MRKSNRTGTGVTTMHEIEDGGQLIVHSWLEDTMFPVGNASTVLGADDCVLSTPTLVN